MAQVIGTCLSDGLLPLIIDELNEWAFQSRMDVLTTVISHRPFEQGSHVFEGLLCTAINSADQARAEVAAGMESWLAKHKASHLCGYFLHIPVAASAVQMPSTTMAIFCPSPSNGGKIRMTRARWPANLPANLGCEQMLKEIKSSPPLLEWMEPCFDKTEINLMVETFVGFFMEGV